MGTCKTKADQEDLGIFTHIRAYLDVLRHNQAYSRIIQAYPGIFRTVCNSGIFTLKFSEQDAYSECFQTLRWRVLMAITNLAISTFHVLYVIIY